MFDYIWLTAPNKTDQAKLHISSMCDLQISDKVYRAISFSTTISEKKKKKHPSSQNNVLFLRWIVTYTCVWGPVGFCSVSVSLPSQHFVQIISKAKG